MNCKSLYNVSIYSDLSVFKIKVIDIWSWIIKFRYWSLFDITVFLLLVDMPLVHHKMPQNLNKQKKQREFQLPFLQTLHTAYAFGGGWLSDNLDQMKGMNVPSFHQKEDFCLRKVKSALRTLEGSLSADFWCSHWLLYPCCLATVSYASVNCLVTLTMTFCPVRVIP